MIVGEGTNIWHPEKSILLSCIIGERCTIHAPVWIGNGVIIGDDCKIQAFVFMPQGVTIGNNVFIGPNVTMTNDPKPPSMDWEEIVIEDDVVIGAGAIIKAGVKIHQGSKIGCGAVVTKDIYPGAWNVGIPARPIQRH